MTGMMYIDLSYLSSVSTDGLSSNAIVYMRWTGLCDMNVVLSSCLLLADTCPVISCDTISCGTFRRLGGCGSWWILARGRWPLEFVSHLYLVEWIDACQVQQSFYCCWHAPHRVYNWSHHCECVVETDFSGKLKDRNEYEMHLNASLYYCISL
jgi:hypothetical protein